MQSSLSSSLDQAEREEEEEEGPVEAMKRDLNLVSSSFFQNSFSVTEFDAALVLSRFLSLSSLLLFPVVLAL